MWVFWGLFGSYWGFIANLTYFISILQRSYARFMYLKHLPCGVIRIYMTYIVENCTSCTVIIIITVPSSIIRQVGNFKFKLRLILAIFKSILKGWFLVVGKTWSDCNFSIHLFLFKLEYSNLDNRLFWFEKTFFIFCLINFQPVILSTF